MASLSSIKLFLAAAALTRAASADHARTDSAVLATETTVVDAATAQLSQEGYESVASLGDKGAMLTFVRRVLEHEGFRIQDEGHLQGMVAFYDGDCATQTFDALIKEINKGVEKGKCSGPWLAHANQSASSVFLQNQAAAATGSWSWMSRLISRIFGGKEEADANEPAAQASTSFEGMSVGAIAGLSEEGYKAVAATRNKAAMALFVHRVLKREGLRVADEGAFQGMLRFYDGECDTQSYAALLSELKSAVKRRKTCFGGPWLEREKAHA